MNFDIHKENREEIINFLKADLLGPASLSKYIKFEGAPSFFDTKKYGKVNFSFFK